MPRKPAKLKTLPQLLTLRELWAWEGARVVFTNGVFDILHAGHVELLQKAKAQGAHLIVGLNSDRSVRRLNKGPGRPVNAFADRAAVLAALSAVSAIIGFNEDTPRELLRHLRPDILVKGADYNLSEIAGAQFAGKVIRIPLKKGYSTTKLIRSIIAGDKS